MLYGKLAQTLSELDRLEEDTKHRSSPLGRAFDDLRDSNPFFSKTSADKLEKVTEFVEEYFKDSQKQARINLIAMSA